jgi:hypothetical protein
MGVTTFGQDGINLKTMSFKVEKKLKGGLFISDTVKLNYYTDGAPLLKYDYRVDTLNYYVVTFYKGYENPVINYNFYTRGFTVDDYNGVLELFSELIHIANKNNGEYKLKNKYDYGYDIEHVIKKGKKIKLLAEIYVPHYYNGVNTGITKKSLRVVKKIKIKDLNEDYLYLKNNQTNM